MKKPLVILTIIAFALSCKKESPVIQKKEASTVTVNSTNVNVKDEMLHFDNMESLIATNSLLSSMTVEDRRTWCNDHNVPTQLMIVDELNKAQDSFEDIEYAGLDENISLEEMKAIGLKPEWCPEIKEYEDLGVLKTNIEKDGISFEALNERFNTLAVVNKEGFVLVGKFLYLYKNEQIKIMEYTSNENKDELLNTHESSSDNSIQVISFGVSNKALNEREKIIGNIFNQTSNNWVWYYNSSSERFNHYVRMYSYEYWTYAHIYPYTFSLTMYNSFTTLSTAERKRFGIWKRRSSYLPIRKITGSWGWYLWPLNTQPSFNNSQGVSSPFNTGALNTNYKNVTMTPTGIFYYHHSGDYIQPTNINIRGSFAGGPSGYSTYYHN